MGKNMLAAGIGLGYQNLKGRDPIYILLLSSVKPVDLLALGLSSANGRSARNA